MSELPIAAFMMVGGIEINNFSISWMIFVMKKFFAFLCVSLLSSSGFSSNNLPLPDSGIQLINLDDMTLPDGFKEALLKRKQAEKDNGYFSTYSETAAFLLQLKNHSPSEITKFRHNSNVMDTHLKSHWREISLTFKYTPIRLISTDAIIGFSPLGTFIDDPHHASLGHWSGIKVFFTHNELGTCEYSYLDLKASHGAVQLSKETTEQLVNQKPSSKTIEGNKESGYLYEVTWFTPLEIQQLSCAKPIFEKSLMAKELELASQLDKNTHSFQTNK